MKVGTGNGTQLKYDRASFVKYNASSLSFSLDLELHEGRACARERQARSPEAARNEGGSAFRSTY